MEKNTQSSPEADFDTQNIFDELSESQQIGDEVQQIEEIQKKDIFFYLKRFNSTLFYFNILVAIVIGIFMVYSFIQSDTQKREYSFLAPICSIFLGDVNIVNGTCYGVTSMVEEYKNNLQLLKKSQAETILPILGVAYAIENFNLSKKVSFLLEKNDSRLRPLIILEEFDALKSIFAPVDKKEIRCYNISIREGNIMDVTCDAFSSDWDSSITSLGGESFDTTSGGTSISRASSFIYFIENHPDSNFTVLEKPQTLSRNEVQELPYTQKTSFNLQLRYNDSSSLPF